MNNQTDDLIISKILAGDIAVYSVLVNKYSSMVVALAYNIILNKEDAEEVAQDAFVKAFAALRSFKKQSAFATWLYRIVVNTALNKKKLRKFTIVDIEETVTGEEYACPLLQQYESEDQQKFIQLAMRSLRDEERICITMFYLNELSVNEIHALTGITAANVKVLLHRGRKHLYDQLDILLKKEMRDLI